jgi:uncharacterized protein (DUF1697 family)
MSQHVAFLRAINVGGHASVKMTVFKRAFAAAGCKDVRTYIQSGNVLFDSGGKDPAILMKRVQARLRRLVGGEATVVCRTLRELQGIVKAAPFKRLAVDRDVKLYVAFLSQRPRRKPSLPIVVPKEGLEVVKAKGMEAFIVSRRKGSGMYGFPNGLVEKKYGVPATTRNWTTVTKVADLLS